MASAESRVTKQNQTSVPAEIGKRLGIAPGSVLEWLEDDTGHVTGRRAGRYSSEDIYAVLFDSSPDSRTVEEMDSALTPVKRVRFQN